MSERRAYVCFNKDGTVHTRVFLFPGEPEPKCEQHGKMRRQANLPYMQPKPKRRGKR